MNIVLAKDSEERYSEEKHEEKQKKQTKNENQHPTLIEHFAHRSFINICVDRL